MKPTAICAFVALLSAVPVAASAKVTNTTQSDSDRITQTLAGPAQGTAKADNPKPSTAQPSKQELKKAKVKPKPGLNDPN